MDITDAMLEEGRKEAERLGIKNVAFVNGDACQIGSNGEFDIAMSRLAFHHFLDPDLVLKQMIQATKPKGSVIVCDLLSPEDPALSQRYNSLERLRDGSHTTALAPAQFSSLFEQAGLLNIKVYFRHVVNDLEAWMKMTATPEQNRQIIRSAIKSELDGGEKTGFSPFVREDGTLLFAHRWMMIIGTKP